MSFRLEFLAVGAKVAGVMQRLKPKQRCVFEFPKCLKALSVAVRLMSSPLRRCPPQLTPWQEMIRRAFVDLRSFDRKAGL